MHEWSCHEIARHVRVGDVSAEEIVTHHLDRIEARGDLNAFVTVDRERALLDARSLARQGRLGALAGVPFAPKDIFDTAGMRTTYGSALFREHVPTRTASAVQRLADAGAVIVGKANLHEFAWGVTSKNPFYGTVGNPRHPGHVAGGSSGGSAAALAAGLAALSIGTDTGGSIRIPSFACGTAGFKPSHGLVPLDGCFPLAPCFDHAGPMARTMEECALALEVLADVPHPVPRLAGLRIGVLDAITDMERLEESGAACEETALPPWEHALPIFAAECAYVHRDLYAERSDEYSPDLQCKLAPGFELPAVAFRALWAEVDAWRLRCERELHYDVLVAPTLSCELPLVSEEETPEYRARLTANVRPFNWLGWPSATTRDGVLFSGRSDATVLAAALAWERELPPPTTA
ncbi:MAG: amidase [Actinomycetota bacterium]|nr:amidase [Actinomycetota bacterium]